MRKAWSDAEIRVAVDSYFVMLMCELAGASVTKAEHRRRAQRLLPGRTAKAVEYKWCNVSAVLSEASLPWIGGFKPLSNYQGRLRELVGAWLLEHPYSRDLLASP
ncbi:MAG: hypothetical protein QY307_07325 [Acidimicrobiia bacterium]|nr:MAG: hypothetical protein QY307_07325 [Acidimicrobiia bacterium]